MQWSSSVRCWRELAESCYIEYRYDLIVYKLSQLNLSVIMSNNELGSGGSKMQLINERWQEIQVSMEREKNYRVQSLEDQMNALEERMVHSKAFNQQRILILSEKIEKSKDQLAVVREKKEEVDQTACKKIASIEEGIQKELEVEKSNRSEYTDNWIRKSDEKLLEVCNSMESITAEKGETVEHITTRIKKRLADIEIAIDTEKKVREEDTAKITNAIEQQLNRLYSDLQVQKKTRQQTNRKIQSMLKEIHQKLQSEIEQQRKLRKQTNNSLLTLLQQTCIKVQKAFQ